MPDRATPSPLYALRWAWLLGRWLRLVALLLLPALTGSGARAQTVQTGIDVLVAQGFAPLQGRKVGLISNPTGVDRRGKPTWSLLHAAPGVRLVALFGAEHGFDGRAKAGIEVPDRTETRTGLPVYSLYGPGRTRKPTPRMLQGLDVLIYDLQDTGCRSYTYISTLGLAMEACAEAGVRFLVLDRPNPLGGVRVEGPTLDPKFKSFVGQWPIPYAYGLTPGELARTINGQRWISRRCQLDVVAMRGWTRRMTWAGTGLRWTASSPNVPSGETPLYLVATGVLGEIGGVNLGTGSSLSFQVIGAPWLDPQRFARAMNRYRLPGLAFEPVEADLNRLASDGREFRGVRVRVTQPATAPVTGVAFHALEAIKATAGRDLFRGAVARGRSWDMFDKVTGSDRTRLALQQGRSAAQIVAAWKPGEAAFRKLRQPYLLYPETTSPAGRTASTGRTNAPPCPRSP